MERFEFSIPTKIYFGAGRINDIGELVVSKYGSRRILILSGNHCLKNGLTEDIECSLKKRRLRAP